MNNYVKYSTTASSLQEVPGIVAGPGMLPDEGARAVWRGVRVVRVVLALVRGGRGGAPVWDRCAWTSRWY